MLNRLAILLIIVFALSACGSSPKEKSRKFSADTSNAKTIDSSADDGFEVDTSQRQKLVLKFEGDSSETYWLIINPVTLQEKSAEIHQALELDILTGTENLFRDTLDYNEFGNLYHPAKNVFFLDLLNSGGGSGYAGTMFQVRLQPLPHLQPVVDFNELSYWESNKSADQLLFFQGSWNMAEGTNGDFETHFDPHIQTVGIYKITEDSVMYSDLGVTENKFDFSEKDSVSLDEFRSKEKKIAALIDWNDFK